MMRGTILACVVFVGGCGGGSDTQRSSVEIPQASPPSAEISELDLGADGIDRFATCPPAGDLGQPWVPEPSPWTPPPETSAPGSLAPLAGEPTRTESAVEATHREFRSCQRKTLVHGASPDGRVAIVLRVAPDGHVAKVEEYGACEVMPDAISCMMHVAAKLHLSPPGPTGDTVIVPATFTGREGTKRGASSRNDTYTANAYLTLEGARPLLHACEEAARTDARPVAASGTFMLTISAEGRVTQTKIEPWAGNRVVVDCAARALERLQFTPPVGGKGFVIARLNFSPRQVVR